MGYFGVDFVGRFLLLDCNWCFVWWFICVCVGLWVGRFVVLSGWVTVYCVCCCVSLLVLDCGGSASEIVLDGLVVLLLY